MTDAVVISLISAVTSTVAAVIAYLNNRQNHATGRDVTAINTNMQTIEKQTNSMKDALVKVTAEAEHAKGVLQEKADQKRREEEATQH